MRRRAATILTAAIAAAGLAGCGGGDQPAADSSPAASATTAAPSPSATPSAPPTPAGEPAPEALSRFRCEKVDDAWAAVGFVTNDAKAKASYQVTVYVGAADGAQHSGYTQQLTDVAPGDSVPFRIRKLPTEGDDGICHVQVLKV